MIQRAEVYRNNLKIGMLSKFNEKSYEFRYSDEWFANKDLPPVSLTMPKTKQVYVSDQLFPFFFNMLSEGVNRKLQSKYLKIDENDHFSLLLATASFDTIGPITIRPIKEKENEHS